MKKEHLLTLFIIFLIGCDLIYFTQYNIPKGHWFEEYSHEVCGKVLRGTTEIHGSRRSTRTDYYLSLDTYNGPEIVEVSRETFLTTGEGDDICQKVYKPINIIIRVAIVAQIIFIVCFVIALVGAWLN